MNFLQTIFILLINGLNTLITLTLKMEESPNFGSNYTSDNKTDDELIPFKNELFKTRYILLIANSCGCRRRTFPPPTQGFRLFQYLYEIYINIFIKLYKNLILINL